MNSSDEMASVNLENRRLLPLLLAVSLALAWILLPFFGVILWGSIIALLFAPVYRRLAARLRQRRTLAALLTLLLVLLIVIFPLPPRWRAKRHSCTNNSSPVRSIRRCTSVACSTHCPTG